MFGKKKAADGRDVGPSAQRSNGDRGNVTISMNEVHKLAGAAAIRQGYPADARDNIANRVVWLERRQLPGLPALILTLQRFGHLPMPDRLGTKRGDGSFVYGCPIVAGTILMDQLASLLEPDPRGIKMINGPSAAVLLLPKIAQYAGPRGLIVRLNWIVDGSTRAQSFVDGFRVVTFGEPLALLNCHQVGFVVHSDEEPPDMRAGTRDETSLPKDVLAQLERWAVQ